MPVQRYRDSRPLGIGAIAGRTTHPPTQDLTETGPIEYRQGCHLLYRATLNPRDMGEGEALRGTEKGRGETNVRLVSLTLEMQ